MTQAKRAAAMVVCVCVGFMTIGGAPPAAGQTSSLTVSPGGTRVPPASSIVDASLAVWTIGSDRRILRNGVHASGGYGSVISWENSRLLVLGTDSRWWQWTGSSWQLSGVQPSASGTRVPSAPAIVDMSLAAWTIAADGRTILRNGVHAAGGYGSAIDWTDYTLTVLGTDSRWWRWTGSGWQVISSSTVTPTVQTSPNGTMSPPATAVVDTSLASWTVAGDLRILRNGVHAAGGYGSVIYWLNSTVYVLGTDQRWYVWNGGGWNYFGATKPGSSTQPTVTGDYYVQPGQNIQAVIDAAAEGATIVLQAGVHRMQTLRPKNRQTIAGASGAILSGARLLTSFSRSGSAWVATGQTQQGPVAGQCQAFAPRCGFPEDLFINDVPLRHVASVAQGGPGKWFFDYAADAVYFWDDPTGRRVEISVTPHAIVGSASAVTVRGLTIEKFASPSQSGAVRGAGLGWTIERNLIRFNHGYGVEMGPGRQVLRNTLYANGQMGVAGTGNDSLVEGNEISYNNTAGYEPYWEAGATKFTRSRYLVLRNNFVHHNDGPGLWTDIDNIDILIENNRVEDNAYTGIGHEISYRAVIRYNSVSRNGTAKPYLYWVEGAGITVSSSSDVEVYGNTLVDNWQGLMGLHTARGDGMYGPRTLTNFHAHDNTVVQTGTRTAGAGRSGIVDFFGTTAFTSLNNRFTGNAYTLPPTGTNFIWMGNEITDAQWRGYGQDLTGTITR